MRGGECTRVVVRTWREWQRGSGDGPTDSRKRKGGVSSIAITATTGVAYVQLPLRRRLTPNQHVIHCIPSGSSPEIVVFCHPRCWSTNIAVTCQRLLHHAPPLRCRPISAEGCEVEAGVKFIWPYVARHLLRGVQPRFPYENTAGVVASGGGEPGVE